MNRPIVIALISIATLSLLACGGSESRQQFVRDPVSVRGWIGEITSPGIYPVADPTRQHAQRLALLQQTTVSVVDVEFASGGVAETGAFIILDVPPGNSVIEFNAPGIPESRLVLERIPPSADLFIPAIAVKPEGVELLQPEQVRIRIPGNVTEATKTAATASINGFEFPVHEVPLRDLVDRRDYPDVPLRGMTPTLR
ncbi:MAG TPA: hypothetical protein VMT00_02510 [Thermoanaerobaculia bacterium]|nr:hypothetical protein [Thermoanaerobaculia bacterium]